MAHYRSAEEGFQQFLKELSGERWLYDAFDSRFLASLQGDLRQKAENLLLEALAKGDDRAVWPLAAMNSEAGYALMERALTEREPRRVRDPAIALWRAMQLPAAWRALTWLLRHKLGSVDEGIVLSEVLWTELRWRNLRWAYWILARSDDSTNRCSAGLYVLECYGVVSRTWDGNRFEDPHFGHIFRKLVKRDLRPEEQAEAVKELVAFARAHKGEVVATAEALPRSDTSASTEISQTTNLRQGGEQQGLLASLARLFRKR